VLCAVSLCRCVQVCRCWRKLTDEPKLWRALCHQPRDYRLSSAAAEETHRRRFTADGDGAVKVPALDTFPTQLTYILIYTTVEERLRRALPLVAQLDQGALRGAHVRGAHPRCLSLLHARHYRSTYSGISCVQFDDDHIVSGSSDSTIKVRSVHLPTELGCGCKLVSNRCGTSEPTTRWP